MLKDVTTKEATPSNKRGPDDAGFEGVNYELKEDEDPHSKLKYGHTISDEQISARNAWEATRGGTVLRIWKPTTPGRKT